MIESQNPQLTLFFYMLFYMTCVFRALYRSHNMPIRDISDFFHYISRWTFSIPSVVGTIYFWIYECDISREGVKKWSICQIFLWSKNLGHMKGYSPFLICGNANIFGIGFLSTRLIFLIPQSFWWSPTHIVNIHNPWTQNWIETPNNERPGSSSKTSRLTFH